MAASPLAQTAATGTTHVWNDSCSATELAYAIENGAVGATSNPVIVGQVLARERERWEPRLRELSEELTDATEEDIAWKLIEEMALEASTLLLPVFERYQGKAGRLSIQTNPRNFRSSEAMVEQALHFASLAPNMQVKIPATRAGIAAIEAVTYEGVSINATVSFSVPQAIAVAEAVERGLKRREVEGRDTDRMSPVCTMMVGRLDDWLKVIAARDDIIVNPEALEWAGVAAMKRAYGIYSERGYRLRLLAAAYRNHYHWSQFVGGEVSMTIPYRWQLRFNASDVEVVNTMNDPVDSGHIATLRKHFPDFGRAYEPDGMSMNEFDSYGATVRTLRSFIAGYTSLLEEVRKIMLPDPDR